MVEKNVKMMGPWGPDRDQRILKVLSSRLHEASGDQRAGSYFAQRIIIAIQRGNAASFLGLLVVTGVLWGCTNPFIRAGTRGLRDVRATSRLGQLYAELAFLLGNWRYVVPWLVNQAGSLSYLLAVRRAPLSLCVPAANALAFACTALAGAATRTEEALDKGSILGILLIVAGTALCCWDKAD